MLAVRAGAMLRRMPSARPNDFGLALAESGGYRRSPRWRWAAPTSRCSALTNALPALANRGLFSAPALRGENPRQRVAEAAAVPRHRHPGRQRRARATSASTAKLATRLRRGEDRHHGTCATNGARFHRALQHRRVGGQCQRRGRARVKVRRQRRRRSGASWSRRCTPGSPRAHRPGRWWRNASSSRPTAAPREELFLAGTGQSRAARKRPARASQRLRHREPRDGSRFALDPTSAGGEAHRLRGRTRHLGARRQAPRPRRQHAALGALAWPAMS